MWTYATGLDGNWYAIFGNTDDAWTFLETYGGRIACFNGYENAVQLTEF